MSFSSNEGPWKLKKKNSAASGSIILPASHLWRVYISDFFSIELKYSPLREKPTKAFSIVFVKK